MPDCVVCHQRTAIAFRAVPLCKRVKRRWALFSSSWGYSKANCFELASQAEQKDRLELQALQQRYAAGPVKLIDENHQRHLILRHGSYLRGSENNIRLYLPRTDLLDRFPAFQPGRPYVLETKLVLSVGIGGPGGWLRDDILDEVFPESSRTQILSSTVEF